MRFCGSSSAIFQLLKSKMYSKCLRVNLENCLMLDHFYLRSLTSVDGTGFEEIEKLGGEGDCDDGEEGDYLEI